MQIHFSRYFTSFNQWQAPIYWIAGQGDGRLDIEARLLAPECIQDHPIVHLELKSQADFTILMQHWMTCDLFSASPIIIIRVANAQQIKLAEWLQQQEITATRKVLIWSDKLSAAMKKHSILQAQWLAFYPLWPYQPQQIQQWWAQHCQKLKLAPTPAVTQACLLQTGFRMDALRQITAVWALTHPDHTPITAAPFAAADQLTEQVYDEALNWLRAPESHKRIQIQDHMNFYFAIKQTIDDVIQLLTMEQHGLSMQTILQKKRWWPKKLESLRSVARCKPFKTWVSLLWSFSHLDEARFGVNTDDFNTAFNVLYTQSPSNI